MDIGDKSSLDDFMTPTTFNPCCHQSYFNLLSSLKLLRHSIVSRYHSAAVKYLIVSTMFSECAVQSKKKYL